MTDPLEVLRQPLVPLAPDPAFAARLRERIRLALDEDGSTETGEGAPMPATTEPVLAASEGDVVYLSLQVPDAARAREFYSAVLGWRFGTGEEPGDDRVAQGLSLPIGVWDGPGQPGVSSPGVFTVRRVADLAAAIRRVRELDGTATDPIDDRHGLMSECTDNQGHGFNLVQMEAGEPRSPLNAEVPGDITYLTISPGDEVRASRFYGALFGWKFTPGHVARGLNVDGPRPMTGMWGGSGRQFIEPVYSVADVEAAVRRVRGLGGTATDPHREPYGLAAECVDNQGLAFGLMQ